MLVKEVMKSRVATCQVDANLQSVALLMWNHDCGSIPVVDSANKPIGIVTDRDIAMACSLNSVPLWEMRAGDVVDGRPLYACNEDDDIAGALALMETYRVRRLPVTDSGEQLRGMLSMSDVIRAAQKRPGRSKAADKLAFEQLAEPLKALSIPHSETQAARAG